MRRTIRNLALCLLVLVALVACGQQAGPSNLFVEENAWKGDIPGGATMISPDEFRAMVAREGLVLRTGADVDAQFEKLNADFASDLAYLLGLDDPSPALLDLLAAVGDTTTFTGDILVDVGGETFSLQGLGTRVAEAAETARLSASADNAFSLYDLSYSVAPADVRSQLPTPASLQGKPLADISAALAQLNGLLAAVPNLDMTRLELTPTAPGNPELLPQSPGGGVDTPAACTGPTGFVARIWFPLKSFISPIRSQGQRGTCWAFTAIGALESRELVQNGTAVNLSEQFLVNKVKNDWDEADYSEGYFAGKALNLAVSKRQVMAPESSWTYNSAPNRVSMKDGSAADYVGVCDPYGQGPNAGWCSETAHESPAYCTTFIFTFCGYKTIAFAGPGVAASKAVQVWSSGERFDLENYRNLLASGHVLMASFPVYQGFEGAVGGVVSDYAKKHLNAKNELVDGDSGGHAVQIVAFLSNAELSTPSYTYNIGGGGYFVIKNSWGCGSGDGGYWYVPADYVWTRFNRLEMLEFDTRRSSLWTKEQANPGSTEAPAVSIKKANASADLRVPTDLADFFAVTHSVAGSVSLVVSSDKDGTLFNGSWNTAQYTFPPSLVRTFASTGTRTLTVRATYAGNVTQRTLQVNVINSAPTLSLTGSGTAFQGEPYVITATVADKNDSGSVGLCSRMQWTVTAPDTITSGSGCQVTVVYPQQGSRTVTATTTDAEGLRVTRNLTLTVAPPPPNPYPRITDYGMRARTLSTVSGIAMCVNSRVAVGATIDLTATGCNFIGETGVQRKHSAFVTVQNPDNEALIYDWTLTAILPTKRVTITSVRNTSSGTGNEFVPGPGGNSALGTDTCELSVFIHAPEAARNKSLTVWSGSCTYYASQIN